MGMLRMTRQLALYRSKAFQYAALSSRQILKNRPGAAIFNAPPTIILDQSWRIPQWKSIHLSQPRNALPPVILLLLRPIAKLGAILFGRFLRKWWRNLPPHEREKIVAKLKSKKTHLAFAATLFAGGVFLYYLEHVDEEPITKRKRFILYNEKQMLAISQMEFDNQVTEHEKNVVPMSHPIYIRVAKVANRVLYANKDLPQITNKKWGITVIDRPDVTNAFVLPHGKIFLFTGMLNICTNDDQLAIVLSHEIAHAVLTHMAENLSKTLLVEFLLLIPLIIFWAVFGDAGAIFSQWLSGQLANIMIHLPFSRAIEKEADEVGLALAARACFDIREAPVFWAKMNIVNKSLAPIEWLSTHPSNENRQADLAQLLPVALNLRTKNQCPSLPPPSYAQIVYAAKPTF